MRSGFSLTDRVCRDATSLELEGDWKVAHKAQMQQAPPMILRTDTAYSPNLDDYGRNELIALRKLNSAMTPKRATALTKKTNDSVRFQSFVSAE
jgi:hypothetical protein